MLPNRVRQAFLCATKPVRTVKPEQMNSKKCRRQGTRNLRLFTVWRTGTGKLHDWKTFNSSGSFFQCRTLQAMTAAGDRPGGWCSAILRSQGRG